MSRVLKLKTRYYRALPADSPGYEEEVFELPAETTALLGMHCWNIGCPDGPAVDMNYCVGMGWPQAAEEASRIMGEVIRPAMDMARGIGVPVCHVETDWMDVQYPEIPSLRVAQKWASDRQREMAWRAHGKDYLEKSPLARMRRAEIVARVGDEKLVFYTDQVDAHLQDLGIDTLIYAGFAADMCVLNSEGGARAMLGRGYRCILMRDATVGVETPESFPERRHTRYGIHLFEWQVGHSTTYADFAAAVKGP